MVFNASQPTSSGLSVNDIQLIGPTIQDSLFNILLRFRQYKYILSGDIEKMYRQVLVRESDRNLQLILWRNEEDQPLRTFQLNTVTYGFASASFLSTRCIWQLGEECDDPKIKQIIQKDFYCDDLLTGANSDSELRHIQHSVSEQLSKGCFNLRKYRSNLPDILPADSSISTDNSNLLISNATSTLGIGWDPTSDEIHFPIQYSHQEKITKRSILSSTFKVFDPLGLLSLCIIKAKILLQRLWADKTDWDEPVPLPIRNSWLKFSQQIKSLSDLRIPRHVIPNRNTVVSIELHSFCDASQQAYGSCIFLRTICIDGSITVNLLCAKARVAPIKVCTIPRLELCGALLGAQLSTAVTKALRYKTDRQVYWTDSSIVLGWLKSPGNTKTFVANRVAAIGELTNTDDWRHVPTSENPADLASRGVDPQDVKDSNIWWQGPTFLRKPEAAWPSTSIEPVQLPELKAATALVAEAVPFFFFCRKKTRYEP